jgi:hypothetical protein
MVDEGGLSKQEKYILYSLGQCYKSFNKLFSDKPLEMTISKTSFIDILISSNSVNKQARAIYKNLEELEKKKYVKYVAKELAFTKKGFSIFQKLDCEIKEYVDLLAHLYDPKTINMHRKLQTKLKG